MDHGRLSGLLAKLSQGILYGHAVPLSRRQHPHTRMYTKRYADGRQKGGARSVIAAHPAPAPSAKARLRAAMRTSHVRRGIRSLALAMSPRSK